MDITTKKITTPFAKAEVEIKDWISGGDAEYIDDALINKIDMKPDQRGSASFGKFEVGAAVNEHTHREIEKFVVSVNGIKDEVVKAVLNLPEDDYNVILKEIKERRKKKEIVTATP